MHEIISFPKKMSKLTAVLLLLTCFSNFTASLTIQEVYEKLNNVLNFMDEFYLDINIDGLFGMTLAKVHLIKSYKETNDGNLLPLIQKCSKIQKKILPNLPKFPYKMIIFEEFLLNTNLWLKRLNKISFHELKNLGTYNNWTIEDIIKNRKAQYKGIPTDVCLLEILQKSSENDVCYVSPICQTIMFEKRIDTGYLLTHRLLYFQILGLKNCILAGKSRKFYTKKFCSLILKEAKTSESLGYPYHDLFLEQVLLCGTEGYAEFLSETWLSNVLNWQKPEGCYTSFSQNISKRTSNVIEFGCSDHSTGIGSGVLAMYLRFLLQ